MRMLSSSGSFGKGGAAKPGTGALRVPGLSPRCPKRHALHPQPAAQPHCLHHPLPMPCPSISATPCPHWGPQWPGCWSGRSRPSGNNQCGGSLAVVHRARQASGRGDDPPATGWCPPLANAPRPPHHASWLPALPGTHSLPAPARTCRWQGPRPSPGALSTRLVPCAKEPSLTLLPAAALPAMVETPSLAPRTSGLLLPR